MKAMRALEREAAAFVTNPNTSNSSQTVWEFKQIKGSPTVCSRMQFIVFLSLQEGAEAGAKARFEKVLENS